MAKELHRKQQQERLELQKEEARKRGIAAIAAAAAKAAAGLSLGVGAEGGITTGGTGPAGSTRGGTTAGANGVGSGDGVVNLAAMLGVELTPLKPHFEVFFQEFLEVSRLFTVCLHNLSIQSIQVRVSNIDIITTDTLPIVWIELMSCVRKRHQH